MMKQKYLSAETSINTTRLPQLHKDLINGKFDEFIRFTRFVRCLKVYDYGCGRASDIIECAYENVGIKYHGYDLTYKPEKWEDRYDFGYRPNITTISNVLNVIEEDDIVKQIIRDCVRLTLGYVIIKIYEGNKTGIGKETKGGTCYQRNMKTADYLPLINDMGFDCFMKYGYIFIKGEGNKGYRF